MQFSYILAEHGKKSKVDEPRPSPLIYARFCNVLKPLCLVASCEKVIDDQRKEMLNTT